MSEILAIYLRLSHQDEDCLDESNSICNQREMAVRFIDEHTELKKYVVCEYVDDGYSGKNFERPAIKRLLADVKKNKVRCIIVKDFSRFARDYIQTGEYVEKIFPFMNVRFISMNDNFDSSELGIGDTPDLRFSFQNLVNDYHSVDTSQKVRFVQAQNRKIGKHQATIAPYGYRKDPEKQGHLIVDEEAAEVVRKIFSSFLVCGNKEEVARKLEKAHIPTPAEYMRKKGLNYSWKYQNTQGTWSGAIVGRILRNRMYIGDMVSGKVEVVEISSVHVRQKPKKEWVIVGNTHEPIISKELFYQVQTYKKEKKSVKGRHKKGSLDSPIKGFVQCGGCRKNLIRRARQNPSYYCKYYYSQHHDNCLSHHINERELINSILTVLRKQVKLVQNFHTLYKEKTAHEKQRKDKEVQELENLQHYIRKVKQDNFLLYKAYISEQIEREQFIKKKKENQIKIEQSEDTYQRKLQNQQSNFQEIDKIFLDVLSESDGITELTHDVVEKLIQVIYVHPGDKMVIRFGFQEQRRNL